MSETRNQGPAGADVRALVESLTMRNFELRLTLGNAAMLTPDDVAEALNRAADGLWNRDESWNFAIPGEGFPVYDVNGNRVGAWAVR